MIWDRATQRKAVHVLHVRLLSVGFSLAVVLCSGRALAVDPQLEALDDAGSRGPKVGFTLLGGMTVPWCGGQPDCGGQMSIGPSIAALVLFAPNDSWAVGLEVQVSRVHWREPYLGMVDGMTHQIDLDLTAGFAAAAARYTLLPEHRVTPLVQAAIGAGLQKQTGTLFQCEDGGAPTGQLAIGARAQASKDFSFLALASATFGIKLSGCSVSDGPGPAPFAGWGVGLQVGAAYDLLL